MSGSTIGDDVRQRVQALFRGRCAYCHSPLFLFPAAKQIDHIVPRRAGGGDAETNLCLCCANCNGHKAQRTSAIDPLTFAITNLFHPRMDRWNEHFAWTRSSTRIVGLSACGRTTVEALQMNEREIVQARQIWTQANWHPPHDDNVVPVE